MPLNDNQRRVVSTTIRHCAATLEQIAALLAADPAARRLTPVRWTLPADRRAQLRIEVQAILETLAGLLAALALPVSEQDGEQWIRSHLTAVWSALDELGGSKLRGYGPVDDDVRQDLYPRLHRLIQQVETLQAHLAEERPSAPADGE